jgi:hypothetical protein
MGRKPNINPPTRPGLSVQLMLHEVRRLKINKTQGGWQDLENWIVGNIDSNLSIFLDPVHLERIERCCLNYGPGGPNARIRGVFIPALRRHGIDLAPEWRNDP